VKSADVQRVRRLLAEYPALIKQPVSPDGITWLHRGAETGSAPLCELLIRLGCDVNAKTQGGMFSCEAPPLNFATTAPVVHCLLAHGAHPGGAEGRGGGYTHALEELRLLDKYGCNLHQTRTTNDGQVINALTNAIDWGKELGYEGRDDVAEFLRFRAVRLPDEEADRNRTPSKGIMTTPDDVEWRIVDAVRAGDVTRVRQLMSEHPEYLHKFHYGHTWLQIAAHYDSVPMIKLLIELGIDVNAEGVNHSVALDAALGNDNLETVRALLEHGANPNQGKQVLWAIVGNGRHSLELLKLLEQHGADLFRTFVNESSEEKQQISAFIAAKDWAKKDVTKYLQTRKKTRSP
jgi:hypothetical protein